MLFCVFFLFSFFCSFFLSVAMDPVKQRIIILKTWLIIGECVPGSQIIACFENKTKETREKKTQSRIRITEREWRRKNYYFSWVFFCALLLLILFVLLMLASFRYCLLLSRAFFLLKWIFGHFHQHCDVIVRTREALTKS